MNMNQKGIAPVAIILVILGILALGGGSYYAIKKFQKSSVQPCTLEAKQCPDGSYVGRTGPNCEFAACPEAKINETANWKTYTDSNLNYYFQYPPTSCELQRFAGDTTFAICYLPKGSDGGPKHNIGYVISLGFISKNQLSVMGVTYCGAYPNDSSRCELFKMGEVTASIDWGTGADGNASAWIYHRNGGIITFDLQPVTAESKEILKQILSTFKFTN